jgi:hypothetical protein
MSQPIRSPRRQGRVLSAALAVVLAACADGGEIVPLPPEPPVAATLQLVSRNPAPGLAGARLPDSVVVRALDAQGRPLANVPIGFSASVGGQALPTTAITDAEGYAKAVWQLAPAGSEQRLVIGSSGAQPVNVTARVVTVPEPVRHALSLLNDYLFNALQNEVLSLPLNPHITPFMQAKIDLMRTPGLGSDILEQGRYAHRSIVTRAGASVPLVAVFPVEGMRAEAVQYMDLIESGVPVLEEFFDMSFPAQSSVRMWYGFKTGMSGGGGTISVEDRTTYDARTQGRFLPYEPGIIHELGHSYVGSESLTQFLEVYGDNVLRTGSRDLAKWTFTRSWVPGRADNEGVHALLDVYQMIGPDAMAAAFRAVVPLRPPYGQPLTAAMQQVFVDAAPAAVKPQVAAKMARVRN